MKHSEQRPIAFILASTNHGSMLLNRHDYREFSTHTYGVGHQILSTSAFDEHEIEVGAQLLATRRHNFGDGVVAIDGGANIGVHTVEWARTMHGWGRIISFEAQERIFYALAGNITLNNCFNAKAIWAAVGGQSGEIRVPVPDYVVPSSFGSLELRRTATTEDIGQPIDYSEEKTRPIPLVAIDDMQLDRLDFMKLDIEGMEIEALAGAERSIDAFRPQLMIEVIKSDEVAIRAFLERLNYHLFPIGLNLLAIHESDPTLNQITMV
jgi:FkbM family methyltransferase